MTQLAFIMGCPRSGTTFLTRALQPLDGAEVLAGLIYPPHLAHLAAATDSEAVRATVETSFRWSLEFFAAHASRSRGWVVGEWTKGNASTRDVVDTLRGSRRVRTLVYKEPFLAFAPQLAFAASPGARVILLHRDGRDCADSLDRRYSVLTDERLRTLDSVEAPLGRLVGDRYVPWWVARSEEQRFLDSSAFVRSVWMWREMARRCFDMLDSADAGRSGQVLVVPYDRLMADPLGWGTRVADHLGHRLTRRAKRRLQSAHQRSIGVHTRRDRAEVAAATAIASDELARWGYRTDGSA